MLLESPKKTITVVWPIPRHKSAITFKSADDVLKTQRKSDR